MQRLTRIPLFPLDVVLLPGAELPLHIFEPRYKLMIRRCLDEKIEFGMILAAGQSVAGVGCTAEIVQKIREYADGRMDILAKGRAIFQLQELLDEKEYYEGLVEYLAEGAPSEEAAPDALLRQAFEKCHTLLFATAWRDDPEAEPSTLCYRMAALLPVEIENRQALLEMRSGQERRAFLLRWIEQFLPKLAAQYRARRLAGGNGQTLN